ncbi:hypothetical protein ECEPECA12_5142 [Escherichia coli EPECa12]|uniref:Uncharacterized protein n=1 Tax=Escherichia coli TaxID=562 RepID=A0A6G5ZXT1_ECOLX|nr:hypothetical protein ECDEC7A_5393 [Escherichia coli DEC7A]EHV87564.1 hypothetical protein ECDEC7C_1838 [Escherichia coli DEC7C]EHV94283.1 hypothetical protein ECDEC7E_5092 [Escherichia coli DEC7E]EHV96369.1 hypothetical protein ECDEC7D_0494 [Escherichia coli DEC7D]EIQ58074.1 hypothetical protein ECEPECA12_5142 [Escherichia coli EPECa12]QHW11147.1 Hypothetical protein [Escherichia coli]
MRKMASLQVHNFVDNSEGEFTFRRTASQISCAQKAMG